MNTGDLVTITDVKRYLGGDLQSNDDAVLAHLITAASAFFAGACSQPILTVDHDEFYDGKGGARLYLRSTPVLSVSAVWVNDRPMPPAFALGQAGWRLNGNVVVLFGHLFTRGFANVRVAYSAGYAATPGDVSDAVLELVGLRYRGRDRLGKLSESIGGIATTSYTQKDVSPFIQTVIDRYSRANLA